MSRRNGAGQRWDVLAEGARAQLWPVPAAGVVVAVALGVALPRLDASIVAGAPEMVGRYLFSGGPDAAREVLAAVAASLITVTSLTFSLTVVTLQLASTQYSPRVLRTFSRDRGVHSTLALMLGTFVYALTVLRTVRSETSEHPAFVPRLSVTFAFGLTVASVLALVLFLAHLARQIRVESILRDVHETTTATMRAVLGDATPGEAPVETGSQALPAPPSEVYPLEARSSGFLTSVAESALLEAVVAAGAVLVLDREPGASLIAGTPIARTWAVDGGDLDEDVREKLAAALARCVRTGHERTSVQDVAFGLRQLVDVIARALSPGVNDPTTAVHALSHASALLVEAAGHGLGPKTVHDDSGRVRVVLARPDLASLLELVIAQPLRYGRDQPEVLARLIMLLAELAWSSRSTPARHPAILDQLRRILSTVDGRPFPPAERLHLRELGRGAEEALAGRWGVFTAGP